MKREEFYFLSANGKTNIHGVKWFPEGDIKAILQIAHGVTEHILRYEEFARYFVEHKIAVVGIDLLGHGTSISEGLEPMYFGPVGSWDFVVKDLDVCKNLIQQDYPGVPYYLLGFSLGSFLARTYAIHYPKKLDGLILVGTGQTPVMQIGIAKLFAILEARKVGEDKTTPLIKKLTFDTYNQRFKPNRTDFDWLCASEKSLDDYIHDPLRGGNFSTGLFRELLSGMYFTGQRKNIQKMDKGLPVILLSGEEDPVGECGKGVQKVFDVYQKCGIKDVSMKLYPGLRHDILHEDNREEIYKDIFVWMENHLECKG